jgi:hypothetical protein
MARNLLMGNGFQVSTGKEVADAIGEIRCKLGDNDLCTALDMCVAMMHLGERASVRTSARFDSRELPSTGKPGRCMRVPFSASVI